MSDPVTNVEIEDVLSSIRRLVSEGDRDRPGAPAQSSEDTTPEDVQAGDPARPDALVLTPALRVAGADEDAPAGGSDESEPLQDDETGSGDGQDAGTGDVAEAHQDSGNPPDSDEGAETGSDSSDDGSAASDMSNRTSLEATIAELEAAISDQPFDWEPDGSEEAEPVVWPSMGRALADAEDAELSDASDPEGEPGSQPGAAAQDDPAAEEARESEDTSWALRAETLDDGDSDTAGTELPPLGADDEDAADWPGDAAYAEDDFESVLSGDGMIDEAMLRDLVAEIVREELQGALGERITRNVRKLVRREIHRVLSSQEFD